MASKEEPERGFTVVDRRASSGEKAQDEPRAAAPPPGEAAKRPRSEAKPSEGGPPQGEETARVEPPREAAARVADEPPLPIDFAGFVLSLATSALYHMGFVGDPERDQPAPAPDLPLARQTIDTLEMLQLKTRGNLDSEETRLLEGVLYELHLRYVDVSKGVSQ
jgi:Domain of unknown function (DUF1844)